MKTYLGVDYGTRRIGLAFGDDLTGIASPAGLVEVRGDGAEEHARATLLAADEFAFDILVIGLPLNMDGTEGRQARKTRTFGDKLMALAGKPAVYFDERLSSFAAKETLRDTGAGRKKAKRQLDAIAAQQMLQAFLDGRSNPGGTG